MLSTQQEMVWVNGDGSIERLCELSTTRINALLQRFQECIQRSTSPTMTLSAELTINTLRLELKKRNRLH